MGTNHLWWHEKVKVYIKHNGVDIGEIIKKGLIIIGKSKDWFTDDDYKLISENSKAIHILYCGLTNEIRELVLQCKSAKEICDYLYYLYATNGKVLDFDMNE